MLCIMSLPNFSIRTHVLKGDYCINAYTVTDDVINYGAHLSSSKVDLGLLFFFNIKLNSKAHILAVGVLLVIQNSTALFQDLKNMLTNRNLGKLDANIKGAAHPG